MKQKLKHGKWRVRWDYGHNSYYKRLLRDKLKLEKSLEKLDKKNNTKNNLKNKELLLKKLSFIIKEIDRLEKTYGKPVNIKTRRSFDCRNKWQAEIVENLFKLAAEFEKKGEEVPSAILKEISELKDAPYRLDYLEEISFQLASICGFQPTIVQNYNYDIFLAQADINLDWLEEFNIKPEEIKKGALKLCVDLETIPLKNKTYIFTGSFVSHTTCDDYIKCLMQLAKDKKIDGIITAGPWVKYIFQHKTGTSNTVLESVRELASKVKIYALRSNLESPELIPYLKELGITFVSRIIDENNEFLPYQFSRISNKNQLSRFSDYSKPKNIFVYTSYVALETRLRKDKLRYLIGSGSASFNTPSSRIWANSYNTQFINSLKYDTIGGHILRFDREGEVYPTSFFYNKKSNSIFCSGKIYTKSRIKLGKLHLVISDVHVAHMNNETFSTLISFIKKYKDRIASFSIDGDFFDNNLLSHWDDKQILNQIENKIKYKSFLHEIALAREVLLKFKSVLNPKTKLIFKLGNHDVNSLKKFVNKSLVHFLSNMLDLKNLLELEKLGFKVIGDKEPYQIGDVYLYHGHEITRNKARGNFSRKNVSGHWHRAKIDNNGVVLPTLQDTLNVDYMSYYKQEWSNGWAVLTEDNKGIVESPELILLKNGKYNDFNGISRTSKKQNIQVPKEITLEYTLD